MNIIKLNDIILDETSGLDEKYINIFNNYLRGRYVHCICWNYVIPLDELVSSNVKSLCDELLNEPDEDTLLDLHGYHWMKLSQIINYVDQSTTIKLNDISKYNSYNDFLPSELTIDDLKKFRTWIAKTILSFNIIKEDKINNMLSYYANGMYDKVIENLTMFSSDTSYELVTTSSSSCGCSQSSQTLAQLQNISTCQPIVLYRKSIYKYMISIFSNMDWWLDFDPEFLEMFKTYIDNIIKINLPIGTSSVIDDDYVECGCNITSNTLQQRAIERLNRLSESLKMMINNDTSGHRNYITSALTDWATYLYEIMEW